MARGTKHFREALGWRIYERRRVLGLTQVEAAGKARITQPYWSSIEAGDAAISFERATAIARVLDMSLDELGGRKGV